MIDLDYNLKKTKFKTQMILQVHDELILESPQEEVEEVKKILENTMQQAFLLDLPLKVDVKVSKFWN
jgi:DNA polymerase-1